RDCARDVSGRLRLERTDGLQHPRVVDEQRVGASVEEAKKGVIREPAGYRSSVAEIEPHLREARAKALSEIGVVAARDAHHGNVSPEQMLGDRCANAARMARDDR